MSRDSLRRPDFSRRRFLAAVGVTAVAGCSNGSSDGGDGSDGSDGSDGGDGADGTDGGGDGSDGGDGTSGTPSGNGGYDNPTPSENPDWEAPSDSPRVDVKIETLVQNLEIPWDIAFTGEGEMYMTERTGQILRFDSGKVSRIARPQDAIDAGSIPPGSDKRPWWVKGGEGGTLGIAVHPNYPDDPYVYVYYTAKASDGKTNRVVRYDVTSDNPVRTEKRLVEDIPANQYHNGGRIRFGPDDNLWICCGDAGSGARAQDLSYLGGKILRITPEGKPAPSNPDLGGDPRVFTYGHRNPQGIDWLPSGVPMITEHGPTNRDEVNVLVPGGNYGWNVVRGGPDDGEWGSYTEYEKFVPPVVNTGPAQGWAPTGATFYTGSDLPAWRNRFIVGGLISQAIWVVTLSPPGAELPPLGDHSHRYDADWMHPAFTATAHRMLHNELGRVRHVTQSPSGELYAITSNRDGRAKGKFPREKDDVLVRLTTA